MESCMRTKRVLQWFVVVAILFSLFASTGSVLAWGGCGRTITVQWGDTLSGLAAMCGTTVDAIRAANPGLGWWVYAGQVLYIPTGYTQNPGYYPGKVAPYPNYGETYVIRRGDTLGNIAVRYGVNLNALLAANPQIWNASRIFPGQVITIPARAYYPPAYYPPPYVPAPVPAPSAQAPGFDGLLTVTAIKGVNIRDIPNYDGKIVLADDYTKCKSYYYRTNSVTVDDAHRRTWVEVVISQSANGYTTGWLPVSGPKDYLNHTGPIENWVTPHIE
jgi:LysM repeat protein